MNILAVDNSPVKHLTLKQHPVLKHWYPVLVTARGVSGYNGLSMSARGMQSKEKASQIVAAHAFARGIQFKDPEPDPKVEHIILCAWCNEKGIRTVVSVKPCPPYQPGEDYGGICPECVKEQEQKMWQDGAPDDLIQSFVDFAERGVPLYAKGFGEIEEGVREFTDWRG